MRRVLLLGGTTEASALARALAGARIEAVFSYAGRTEAPLAQPLPTRIGGFGGAEGLADYLRRERITHIIDATHPFATRISRNALAASAITGTALIAYERAPWQAGSGDIWRSVPDLDASVAALPDHPARVFLAIGKQNLTAFAAKPQHHYLLRLVDAPTAPLPLATANVVIARGPFTEAEDLALLQYHRIEVIIAKNAGGTGADAKLKAARTLTIPVIMIDRPCLPPRLVARDVAEVIGWLNDHPARLGE